MVPLADAFADIDEGYLDLCLMRFALQMTVWTREKAKRFGTAADPRPLYTAAWGKVQGDVDGDTHAGQDKSRRQPG